MRRIWNWAREVQWLNVLAVVLVVAAIGMAALAVVHPVWIALSMAFALSALVLAVLGLRS